MSRRFDDLFHIYLRYSIKMHEQRKSKQKDDDKTPEGAVPAYLLDREGQSRAKVLSNMIKQKRKEKAVSIQSDSRFMILKTPFDIVYMSVYLYKSF